MLSIVIPTYRRTEMLKEHLKSFMENSSDLPFEVIIVNDYKGEEIERESSWTDQIIIVNNPKSGVASARNFGAAQARYKWLLFLDDDMLMNRSSLETYLRHCNSETNKTVNLDWEYTPEALKTLESSPFGRFLITYGFTSLKGWCGIGKWDHDLQLLEGLTSQNLLIDKSVFTKLGGYNENFPFAGAEDFEFAQRAKKNGIPSFVDTCSVMFHNELDRMNKMDWFTRKSRGGATNRIAYDMGFKEVFIPKSLKYSSVILTNTICKCILIFTERTKHLDKLSFSCYKLLLGQALNAGFYGKKYRF